jgi:pilus assembly protein Flp/PilA
VVTEATRRRMRRAPEILCPDLTWMTLRSRVLAPETFIGKSTHKQKGQALMRRVGQHLVQFLKSEEGPTAVEYAVMLAFIILVCVGAVLTLGQNTSGTFNNSTLNSAVSST